MIATTGEERIVGTPTTEYEKNASAGCGGYIFLKMSIDSRIWVCYNKGRENYI